MSNDQWEECPHCLREERQQLREERQKLLAVNTELLEALKGYQNFDETMEVRHNRAMAAIAHAEGRQ